MKQQNEGNEDRKKPLPTITRELFFELCEKAKERGNRIEVMNGKIYEVSRKLLGVI